MESINENFKLKAILLEYLNNPNPDKFMELFSEIKNGSKMSVASLAGTIGEYKEKKNFDLTNDEEQMCAILEQIIKEKVVYEVVRNYKYDEMTGKYILVEDETYNKVK